MGGAEGLWAFLKDHREDKSIMSCNIKIFGKNEKTGEVIREIPSKELQSLQTKIGELVGRIFNGKA